MSDVKLPSQDSATGRGIKTAIQAICGFVIGLIIVVYKVPGVPEAVISYLQNNLFTVLLQIGVPTALSSGFVAFVWNVFRKDVKNY